MRKVEAKEVRSVLAAGGCCGLKSALRGQGERRLMGGEEVDSILEKFQGAPGDWVPMVWMVVLPLGPLRGI